MRVAELDPGREMRQAGAAGGRRARHIVAAILAAREPQAWSQPAVAVHWHVVAVRRDVERSASAAVPTPVIAVHWPQCARTGRKGVRADAVHWREAVSHWPQ
jgi:hypothetical protein